MQGVLKPHVSLNVSNLEASVAFYAKAFGVDPVKRRPGYAKFDLAAPSLNLTMQQGAPTGVNADHFGIQVACRDDVLQAQQTFQARGLATRVEDDVTCCYAVQDKVWITDPDGNQWEVFFVKADAAVMHPPAADACCTPRADGPSCCAPTDGRR